MFFPYLGFFIPVVTIAVALFRYLRSGELLSIAIEANIHLYEYIFLGFLILGVLIETLILKVYKLSVSE